MIVLLCQEDETSNILYHRLNEHHLPVTVIRERKPNPYLVGFLRIFRVGPFTTIGQILFHFFALDKLENESEPFRENIRRNFKLNGTPIYDEIIEVNSVNSREAMDAIKKAKPKLIICHNTRKLSRRFHQEISTPKISMHVGIVPEFRGLNGGYWPIYTGKEELYGTTIQWLRASNLEEKIIEQIHHNVFAVDNYASYTLALFGVSLKRYIQMIEDFCQGKTLPEESIRGRVSRNWYFPTIWGYYFARWRRGVR